MKFPLLLGIMAVGGFIFSSVPLLAEAEKNPDGTYTISGTWTYWAEKDIVAPTGKNDFGDYKTILFKQAVNDFAGMKELKKVPATFKVKARESTDDTGKILIIEEILERVDGSVREKAPEAKK